jgi:hypothetical protein
VADDGARFEHGILAQCLFPSEPMFANDVRATLCPALRDGAIGSFPRGLSGHALSKMCNQLGWAHGRLLPHRHPSTTLYAPSSSSLTLSG